MPHQNSTTTTMVAGPTNLPACNIKTIQRLITADGENKLCYWPGNPCRYYLDLGKGQLINDKKLMTAAGAHIKMIPIAFRLFQGELFGKACTEWLELYFIDQLGNVSQVMLHGYSVMNFKNMFTDLFYAKRKLIDSLLTIKPMQKTTTDSAGKTHKYYLCEFEQTPAPEGYTQAVAAVLGDVPVYRLDTIRVDQHTTLSSGYPLDILTDTIKGLLKAEDYQAPDTSKDGNTGGDNDTAF